MSLSRARCLAGLILLVCFAASRSSWASVVVQQEAAGNIEAQQGTPTPSGAPLIFEVNTKNGEVLVRQGGTQEWKQSEKLNEPTVVGMLDGGDKIYVVTKAVKPPRAKHTDDPEYPSSERGNAGRVFMHIIVNEQGSVRLPAVDESSGPNFSNAAIEAVKKWTFEPGKLDGRPVAALIGVEIDFKLR
jgi:TonB family protein